MGAFLGALRHFYSNTGGESKGRAESSLARWVRGRRRRRRNLKLPLSGPDTLNHYPHKPQSQ